MPLQCDMCKGIRIVPMHLEVLTLRRNKFRVPRFIVTRCAESPMEVTQEPCLDFGRAVLPRRLDMKVAQQRSPTRKRFMVTKRVIIFRKGATHEPRERCAAFMPLQCSICEGIRIVRMLLDEPTLKRNKFRDPRIMSSRRTVSRTGNGSESANLLTRSITPQARKNPPHIPFVTLCLCCATVLSRAK